MTDVLQLYADESGTEPNEAYCIMAGYLGNSRQWTAFNAEWQKVIGTRQMQTFHGLTYFRRSRAARFASPPDAYLDGLLKTIEGCDIVPVGAAVRWSDFRALPEDVREILATDNQRHPYYLAMWQMVGLVCNGLRGVRRERAEVHFVLGRTGARSGHVSNIFMQVVDDAVSRGVIEAEIIVKLDFGTPSKLPQLQAADLLCHAWFRTLGGDRGPLITSAFERATKGTTNLQVLDLPWIQRNILASE